MQLFGDLREQYLEFAGHAHAESPCFEAWSLAVADDRDVLAWIADLPRVKQQPNLVYAAARWHGVPAPGPYAGLRDALLSDDGPLRRTILERSTQTNEVGRLATLVPALARIPGPLALIETGASAGLCLHPDRYDYAWPPLGTLSGSGGPTLTAHVEGPMPIPARHPEVVSRRGVDLHPLDVTDADAVAWLTGLVWPEQDDRRARLTEAVAVARREPPRIDTGDLLEAVPALVEEAGAVGTPVVFHSAVLAYVEPPQRAEFADLMTGLVADGRCHWVSNEAPGVVPVLDPALGRGTDRFVLALDRTPLALAGGHGQSLTWLG